MTTEHVNILFQVIVFLFAISVHESAHAWMAYRLGDPTAFMLGRVTLNPVKHIDLWGTVILPLLAIITHFPVIGWAKPTPVNTRHFKHLVRDDILTSVAGPISNLLVASVAVAIMVVMQLVSPVGRAAVGNAMIYTFTRGMPLETNSVLVPLALLLYNAMFINVLLAVFNLIPVPPLDGSHVVRHFLSDSIRRVYDSVGVFGLFLLLFWGGGLLWTLMSPFVQFFNGLLRMGS
ncbi:MAG: site-2 protease family protein [Terriglobales bacterium]